MGDIDGDYDTDFIYSQNGFTFVARNQLVDSSKDEVKHALENGLHAEEAAPEADPDGDGLNNLEEYLFGGSLVRGDSRADLLPTLSIDRTGKTFSLDAALRDSIADRFCVEVSDDLTNWQKVDWSSEPLTPIDSDFSALEVDVDPSEIFQSNGKAFIRWCIED